MTEIALDCGYPASALKEGVYALPLTTLVGPLRCDLLIYTATASTQGMLGGLVEGADRFASVLEGALRCLEVCSGDPVYADHDPFAHEDDRATHGAACHGCLLIAETSCVARNLFLDRALLVETMPEPGLRSSNYSRACELEQRVCCLSWAYPREATVRDNKARLAWVVSGLPRRWPEQV